MKKKVFLTILVGGLLFVTTACGGKKDEKKTNNQTNNNGGEQVVENKPVPNTEKGIITEAFVEGLKIDNISLIYFDELSTYNANVTNTTSENISIKSIKISFKDSNNQELIVLTGAVDRVLAPNESATIRSQVNLDLTKAASISYNVVY